MKRLSILAIGIGFLSLFSCTKGSQYLLEDMIKKTNSDLPLRISDDIYLDSFRIIKNEKTVAGYCSLENPQTISVLKEQDMGITKRAIVGSIKSTTESKLFIDLVVSADYSLTMVFLTNKGELIERLTLSQEDLSYSPDSTQIEQDVRMQMLNTINNLKKSCPVELDEITTLTDVEYNPDQSTLTYTYELDVEFEGNGEAFTEEMRPELKKDVLDLTKNLFTKRNTTISYIYMAEDDTINITFTPEDYK